jgi:undecaprenyl-diphosphatase
MKKTEFLFWNIFSASLWGGVYVSVGYFFGASLPFIEHMTRRVSIYSVLAIATVIIVWILIVRWSEVFKNIASDIKRILLTPVFLLGLIIFVILIRFLYNIFFSKEFMYIDNYIQNILVTSRSDWGITFFSFITSFGGLTVAGLIIAGVSLFLLVYKKYPQVVGFWIALFGGEMFVLIGKEFINKSRPIDQVASVFEKSSSFASGHATLAIILYGFLTFLVYRNIKTIWGKVLLIFTTILFVILVGFSRLYLGVHYLSGVLGGYVLGALWLVVGIFITKKIIDLKKTL